MAQLPKPVFFLSVAHFNKNENSGISFKGLLDTIGFEIFPTEVFTLPIMTGWYGVDRHFEQVVQLLDPNGKLVAQHTMGLMPTVESGTSIYVSDLKASLDAPGLYLLELCTGGQVLMRRPIGIYSREGDSLEIPHQPLLNSFMLSKSITNREDTSIIEVEGVIENIRRSELVGQKLVLFVGWSYVREKFNVEVEILDSKRRGISNGSANFLVHPSNLSSFIAVDLSNLPIKRAGTYYFKISFLGKSDLFPLIIDK